MRNRAAPILEKPWKRPGTVDGWPFHSPLARGVSPVIDQALSILADGIREYLGRLPDFTLDAQEVVRVCNVVKPDGSLDIPVDALGVCLVNVEEERVLKTQQALQTNADRSRLAHVNPEIKLNLFVLIAANFATYVTGLKYLSGAIRFFQSRSYFTPQNTPAMDAGLEKLVMELYTLDFEQQNHLWGALGAKYLPSVLYKVRLISIDAQTAIDDQQPITIMNQWAGHAG